MGESGKPTRRNYRNYSLDHPGTTRLITWKCWPYGLELLELLTSGREWQTHKTELPELWPRPARNYRNYDLEMLALWLGITGTPDKRVVMAKPRDGTTGTIAQNHPELPELWPGSAGTRAWNCWSS